MKRVYLTKMRQGEQVAYIGNADPRLLCPLIIHTDTCHLYTSRFSIE